MEIFQTKEKKSFKMSQQRSMKRAGTTVGQLAGICLAVLVAKDRSLKAV